MKTWVVRSILVLLTLALMFSLERNWATQNAKKQDMQAMLNYGVGQATGDLLHVDEYFAGDNPNGYDNTSICNLIANAAGHLEAISLNLQNHGIRHVMGVGAELQNIANTLSHPNKYSRRKLSQYKTYVHQVATQLQSATVRGVIVQSKLADVMNMLYTLMPKEDKSTFYY